MSEPVWDKETIIYEGLTMANVAAAKMEFDPVGHYARNDVLKLNVAE
jgi:nitrilase